MKTEPICIGRFRVQRPLAMTPSHRVFLAMDPASSKQVTITLGELGADPEVRSLAMRQEWELLRGLDHGGIQKGLELGEGEISGAFLVKEYIEGSSLLDVMEGHPPAETSLHLLVQLMHALEAAERAGVIHGDLKPEHAILRPSGQLVLIDFHLGRRPASVPSSKSAYVSPGYSAPEIIQGQSPTRFSDQFSFAVLAHQLITGDLPFRGRDPEAILAATCHQPPVFAKTLSTDACMTFQKALDKDPAHRFQSLKAFMEGLIASMELEEYKMEALLAFAEGGAPPPLSLPEIPRHSPHSSDTSTRPISGTGAGSVPSGRRRSLGLWVGTGAVLAATVGVAFMRSPHHALPAAVPAVGATPQPKPEAMPVPVEDSSRLEEATPTPTPTPSEAPAAKAEGPRKNAPRPPEAGRAKPTPVPGSVKPGPAKKEFNLYDHLQKQESGN